jgi:CBS domain-containing protein
MIRTNSTALMVKPDTPIIECIRTMNSNGYGAILVSDSTGKHLAGIFTERDLLKWAEKIEEASGWKKPVFLLMSKPVLTIGIDDLNHAAEIMLEKGIRHLPVIHQDPDTQELIIGMISMRDILKNTVNSKKYSRTDLIRPIHVGIYSKSKGFRQLLWKMCAERGNTTPQDLSHEAPADEIQAALKNLDYAIMDLDYLAIEQWSPILKAINLMKDSPQIILTFNPGIHTETERNTLTQLGLSGRFTAFMKPINLYSMMDQLI